jgi:hypothetical protein
LIPRGVEEVLIVLMFFCDIEKLMLLNEPDNKTRMFKTLFKGQDLSYFKHHSRRKLVAKDSLTMNSKKE